MVKAVLLLAAVLPACCADLDPWERVKLIEPGKKMTVTLRTGKQIKGKMGRWTPDSIAVEQRGGKFAEAAKADVATVAYASGMSRLHRAGWAAGIGGGIGAALFTGLCSADADCDVEPGVMALGAGLWIGGISAGIAALIPQHKETVYRAPPGNAAKQ